MPFRKKVLYYGLMLLLTLLALEGMARIAYYAAYGQEYGGGPSVPVNSAPPLIQPNRLKDGFIRHPYYGFTDPSALAFLNAMPPRQRRADKVVIGLSGGSVANQVRPFLQEALNRRFAANELPRQPVILNLAMDSAKQPQQAMIVANHLMLGGEFDLIVNLDGVNEVFLSAGRNHKNGVFPFWPLWGDKRVGLTRTEFLLTGQLWILRREQARLTAVAATSPLRRSALFGLTNRYQRERIAAQIIRRNHELAAVKTAYSPEKHGPRTWPEDTTAALAATARFWHRSSLMLSRLAELAGADYYHFLQPNQYAPNSKPLSPKELKSAYKPAEPIGSFLTQGYPLLTELGRDLSGQGVNYFDLTGIFAGHSETLYRDACCHLNDRGNELLAAELARLLEPALRRWGGASPAAAVSPLTAARLPSAAPPRRPPPGFQVSVLDKGKGLRYVREGCVPEDTEPAFFLHLIPEDGVARPPRRPGAGADKRDFSFAAVGGRIRGWQCTAQIPLPDYPIKEMRTGQYVPGQGNLWSAELIVPVAADQLRAEYAALAAADPAARDYFDLYDLNNRLIYLRETCATADAAAGFFLHIVPEDPADLPADRRDYGFAQYGFNFARQGGHFDGKCLAAVALPDYPVKEMRTGQHIPGQGDLWSVELVAAPDLEQLRADYAALLAANPVERTAFDLYLMDNRLLYRRESCAAADTAAAFFLHIIPENPADLPAERRPAGFANSDFALARQGGHFDGKCLAAIPLPEYPIKEMRTGQHIPGQGDLWSARLIVAP